MAKANITDAFCKSVEIPKTKRQSYSDITLTGFTLTVSTTGKKIFYRVGAHSGGVTRTRIGSYPAMAVAQARTECIKLNGDVASGKHPASRKRSKSKTTQEVWDFYYANHSLGVKKTAKMDLSVWNATISKWADKPLCDVTREMVIEVVTRLRVKVDRWHGGPGAVNRFLSVMRSIVTCARDNGWITVNPLAGIKKERIASRERFITEDEVYPFFQALSRRPQVIQDAIAVAIFTGARQSNVAGLKWEQLSPRFDTWIIPATSSKNRDPIHLPLSPSVTVILARRRATAAELGPIPPFVFPSSKSKHGHIINLNRQWKRILTDSGLRDLRLHDLRRTLGSWQAKANVSLTTIGKSLGHKSLSATLIYARLQHDTVRESVNSTAEAIEAARIPKNLSDS